MRETAPKPAILTLRKWKTEGKIAIFETDRSEVSRDPATGWPGAPAAPSQGGRRTRPAQSKDNAAYFSRVCAIVFPMRDSHRLNMSELNDVNHLVRHLTQGRTFFVTRNAANFIDAGKREKLLAAFQISVMTPEEVVTHLSKEEGWKAS